jgi:hypothetical protein
MSGAPMPDEGFLRRWSRLKATGGAAEAEADARPVPAPAPAAATPAAPAAPVRARQADTEADAPGLRLPTLEDAARLTPDADFSAFVAQGVDKSVQRLALKKLFADPHFNAIDGLDIYMSDYNKASPLSPGMLASLKHAPDILSSLFGEREDAEEAAQATAAAPAADAPEHEAGPMHEQEAEAGPPSTQQGKA